MPTLGSARVRLSGLGEQREKEGDAPRDSAEKSGASSVGKGSSPPRVDDTPAAAAAAAAAARGGGGCKGGRSGELQLQGMGGSSKKVYPIKAGDYELLEEIGRGATATVWKAKCIPLDEIVAIKRLDLEKCNSSLEDIHKEAQMMTMTCHPNVVHARAFFSSGQHLWVVMPYCEAGSCLHLMKAHYPGGLGEVEIATILRDTLKALDYLHRRGHIHRDVKAGNILLDCRGNVRLADFGVSACMFDTGHRTLTRKTFVGTPCWMAPEVLEQNGYDFRADIWSFGITALELANGHAPFSKYPPMKVLMMTLQGPSPGLDKDHERKFSKAFKEMVAMCLVKDPTKRPTADKLLKHPFFKHARNSEYLAKHLLQGLPTVEERMKLIKRDEDAKVAAKIPSMEREEEKSQTEYKQGVTSWNFNLEDLKKQAAMMSGEDESPPIWSPPNGTAPSTPDLCASAKTNGDISTPKSAARTQEGCPSSPPSPSLVSSSPSPSSPSPSPSPSPSHGPSTPERKESSTKSSCPPTSSSNGDKTPALSTLKAKVGASFRKSSDMGPQKLEPLQRRSSLPGSLAVLPTKKPAPTAISSDKIKAGKGSSSVVKGRFRVVNGEEDEDF